MGSPTAVPNPLTPTAVLIKERGMSKVIATTVYQTGATSDIAPGPAVGVAHDPASLGRALMAADPPPPSFQTILEAQMFL